jgi:hypothetical protein
MKSSALHHKEYKYFFWTFFFVIPATAWILGGFWFALAGLLIVILSDYFHPLWQSDLTWNDIDNALKNMYKYGRNPCELCFRVGKRKVYIYRDERGNPEKEPIRMSVRIPLDDWKDHFNNEGYSKLLNKFGGFGLYSDDRKENSYGIFPSGGIDDCKEILRILFDKAAGGLKPDIFAKTAVNAHKNIWIQYDQNGNKIRYNR